jgi:signal transduction histidine kinase
MSTLGAGLVAVLFIMVVLGWTVITPLSALTSQVEAITRTDDLSSRVNMQGSHEIGTLAREFDGLLARLEGDIREREKMNDALRESERLAAIGQMSASVAHEIRNPLTCISSAIQVLNKSIPEDDERKAIFREIIDQVNRADGTIRSLLMFAKPWTPEKHLCEVGQMVEDSCNEVEDLEEFRSIRFMLDVSDGLMATLDPGLCRQVLVNLYRNAAHAMPQGGEIRVRATGRDDALQIVVADTGDGIAPDARHRVFDPFFTTKTRGTGLGLPVCRQIIEAHGGTVAFNSTPGEGTAITIELPLGG